MPSKQIDDPRRKVLIQALSFRVFANGLPLGDVLAQSIFYGRLAKLPPTQSIYRLQGQAMSMRKKPICKRGSIQATP